MRGPQSVGGELGKWARRPQASWMADSPTRGCGRDLGFLPSGEPGDVFEWGSDLIRMMTGSLEWRIGSAGEVGAGTPTRKYLVARLGSGCWGYTGCACEQYFQQREGLSARGTDGREAEEEVIRDDPKATHAGPRRCNWVR